MVCQGSHVHAKIHTHMFSFLLVLLLLLLLLLLLWRCCHGEADHQAAVLGHCCCFSIAGRGTGSLPWRSAPQLYMNANSSAVLVILVVVVVVVGSICAGPIATLSPPPIAPPLPRPPLHLCNPPECPQA